MDGIRRWLPTTRSLVGWTLAAGLAQVMSMAQAAGPNWNGLLWLSPGVAASALLLHPRRHWLALVAGYWLICSLVFVAFGDPPSLALIGPLNNVVEIVLIGSMLHSDQDWVDGRSDRLRSWLWFGLWALLIAPMAGAVIGVAVVVPLNLPASVLGQEVVTWYVTDALSLAVLVPLILRLRPRSMHQVRAAGLGPQAAILAGLIALAVLVFSDDWFLPLFLVPIPLVILLFRGGFAGLAVGMAVQVAIALMLTNNGQGPLQSVSGGDPRRALLSCQIYLTCIFVVMVMIAALLDERRQLSMMESASFEVYEWVGELSGDLVIVLEPAGFLRYCAPTVAAVLGREPAALSGHQWWDLLHPDDFGAARHLVDQAARDGRAHGTTRMQHADGRWRSFAVQLRRADGGAAMDHLLIGLIRDDTDQRELERQLRSRASELLSIASVDALTGLPNRRRLGALCSEAWQQAWNRREPLSLLIIDVDDFKKYNDRYGHLAGDQCLIAVADVLNTVVKRPGDGCGRYGGEEFVVILPNTDEAGARVVGDRIRTSVQARAITHEDGTFGVVTVSVGAATCAHLSTDSLTGANGTEGNEEFGDDEFFRVADTALYRAKREGRNTVVAVTLSEPPANRHAVPPRP